MNRNKNMCKDTKGNKSNRNTNYKDKGKGGKRSPKGGNFDYQKEKEYFQQKTNNHATDYFSDQQLAEQNSYVSNRSIVDSTKPMSDTNIPYPTVFVHAYNPSVSVSPVDFQSGSVAPSPLAQAASKLLVAIMANTGRINNYSRNDMIALIAMLGQFIAMTEYARRTFGLYNKFNMINRDIPKQFIEACGFDWDDFRDNYYIYLSRLNWLINQSAQFVIPMDKIPYFRRCRDQFKSVYKDSAGGMTTYHINVPYSTWILDEHAVESGSVLKTVNVTGPHNADYYDVATLTKTYMGASKLQPHSIWTFGEFLDSVYEPLINSIFLSNTFNLIFADLRNSKFQSQYSFEFWHADLVSVDYQADVLEPQEDIMTMYHNTVVVGAPLGDHTTYNETTSYPLFTRYNDVELVATDDNVVYNPTFLSRMNGNINGWNDTVYEPETKDQAKVYYRNSTPIVMDFKDENPSLDLRVDTMMQKAGQYNNLTGQWLLEASYRKFASTNNWVLPLWYCVGVYFKSEYIQNEFNLEISSSDGGVGEYELDVANGWFCLSQENIPYIPVLKAAPTDVTSVTYSVTSYKSGDTYNARPAVHKQVSLKFNRDVSKQPGLSMRLNYPGGAGFGLIEYSRDELWFADNVGSVSATNWDASGFSGDVDYWYVLPLYKLINMFDHAYQHLFTADGIIK